MIKPDTGMLDAGRAGESCTPTWMDRVARTFVLRALGRFPSSGMVLHEPDGTRVRIGQQPAEAEIRVVDWRVYRMLFTGGGLGAAEAYMEGLWASDDLVAVVRFFAANVVPMQQLDRGLARMLKPLRLMLHTLNRNSIRGSRRNISAHYDLGNSFFSLFLDPTMMYSSAIYREQDVSLDQAAVDKLDLVCRKLDLAAHHHLLEIGTGWGGMAIHAAKHYGCRVTTTTISREQYEYACEAVRREGLEHLVTVLDQDYRDLSGKYDRIVSIEMIEAVGHQFLPTYFHALQSLLKEDGKLVLQAITIPDQRYDYALRNVDFIKRYIFPGGFLPSVAEMCRHFASRTELVVTGIEDIGLDYARTLNDWRIRFLDNLDQVRAQGFDERFCRMWDYYLAYCEGAFRERAISTVQLVAAAPGWRP